VLALIESSFK